MSDEKLIRLERAISVANAAYANANAAAVAAYAANAAYTANANAAADYLAAKKELYDYKKETEDE